MDFIGLIIWIAIIMIIGTSVRKTKSKGTDSYSKTSVNTSKAYTPPVYNPQAYNPGNGSTQARPVQPRPTQSVQQGAGYQSAGAQTQPRNTSQTAHTKPVHTMNSQPKSTRDAAMETKAVKQERSTTEILKEKARLDEADHQREKHKQEMENEKTYGRLHSAERLLLGDPVPNGKRVVVCQYCGAENLISARDYTTKYNCYFCREEL